MLNGTLVNFVRLTSFVCFLQMCRVQLEVPLHNIQAGKLWIKILTKLLGISRSNKIVDVLHPISAGTKISSAGNSAIYNYGTVLRGDGRRTEDSYRGASRLRTTDHVRLWKKKKILFNSLEWSIITFTVPYLINF